MPDLLDRLWEATAARFEMGALLVTSADGTLLRRCVRGDVPDLSAAMLGAVLRDAPKLRLGHVKSSTAYFDNYCLYLRHEADFLLTFVLPKSPDLPSVAAIADDVAAILSVRVA